MKNLKKRDRIDNKKNIEDIIALTPMQEGMLFYYLKDPESDIYFEQLNLDISGNIDAEFFGKAWNLVIETNQMLRTLFRWEKVENPMQIILKKHNLQPRYHDFSSEEAHQKKMLLEEITVNDRKEKFHLHLVDVPFRVTLCKIEENKYKMIISNHHILYDGWSSGIILKEFFEIYDALFNRKEWVKPVKKQFKEFVKWMQRQDINKQEKFWKAYLKSFDTQTELSIKRKKDRKTSSTGNYRIGIEKDLKIKLEGSVKKQKTTLAALFYTAWGVLLQRYNNTDDVIFGTTVSGRTAKVQGIEDIVGLFINTIPLRVQTYPNEKLAALLQRIANDLQMRESFESTSLVKIKEYSELDDRKEFFDTIVVIENYPLSTRLKNEHNKLPVSSYSSFQMTNYALTVGIWGMNDIEVHFNYHHQYFDEQTIITFANHFMRVVADIAKNPGKNIHDIDILSKEEKHSLLFELNRTSRQYPKNKTLHRLFEEQARRTPGKIAITANIDFTPIYEDLQANRTGKIRADKYENCCFKKNPYIYAYEDNPVIKIPQLWGEVQEGDYETILLRTQKRNYVMVNPLVLGLLDYFDGKTNLKSLFAGIKKRKLIFSVHDVAVGDGIDYPAVDKKRFALNNDRFEGFIPLVKALYQSNLIDLVDYETTKTGLNISLDEVVVTANHGERKPPGEETQSLLPLITLPGDKKKKSPVLLLGDSTGTAASGLLYLASYLRRNGIEAYCQWNDLSRSNTRLKENTRKLLARIQPRVVGISMKWFIHMARVLEICKIIKEYDSAIEVVLGGNTVSYFWENIIQYQWVDYVVRGDGEVPFLKICLAEDEIPNCLYKNKKEGKVIQSSIEYVQDETNSAGIFLSHLDEIFVSYPEPYLSANFYIYTAKGCPWNCFYCAGCKEIQEKTFNRSKPFCRQVENVRKDIREVKKYTSTLMFDSYMLYNDLPDYYKKVWEGIDLSGHFCEFYLWQLPAPEFIQLVTRTFKFVYFHIDICSLSQSHREMLVSLGLVKPQPTDEEILSFFDKCQQHKNTTVIINQIAGLPYFSREDIKKSSRFISRLIENYSCLSRIDWGRLHAQPGAPITNNYQDYDMYSEACDFDDYLYYSGLNLEEENYPDLAKVHYPFIYSRDDHWNSEISKYYFEVNKKVAQNVESKKTSLMVTRNITYKELEHRANQLAGLLRKRGVKPGAIVGIRVERSLEMCIGILAILKAGGAYLPVDPRYPGARTTYMLKNSGVKILLCTGSPEIKGVALEKVDLNDPAIDEQVAVNREMNNRPPDAAYVIYTSGSTGCPKGVILEHRGVVNTLLYRKEAYKMNPAVTSLQLFSCCFDGFVTSFFTPLISGATVVLMGEGEINDIEKIKKTIATHNINHFISIPQLYRVIIESLSKEEAARLKTITLAGDVLSPELLEITKQKNENIEIVHEYGVTEASIMSTLYRHQERDRQIKIGKPIDNTAIYILDHHKRLLPMGVPGELYLSGEGLARGYLNDPGLTSEKFIEQVTGNKCNWNNKKFLPGGPGGAVFSKSAPPGRRRQNLYKTGDLGRWLAEGDIQFLGRIDHQVKIRGFRIELAEIEACLLTIENIKEAVVLANQDRTGNKYLCAYIVSDRELSLLALRESLSLELPDYMIPLHFIQIKEIPLTPIGKINRDALPEPQLGDTAYDYKAPRDQVEKKLVEIWSEVLGIDEQVISIDANFFELGGHSLRATAVCTKMHKAFNVKVSLVRLFDTPRIKDLASFIKEAASDRYMDIPAAEKRAFYPLSFKQKRLWFLQQQHPGTSAYNMPASIELNHPVSGAALKKALNKVVERHESFRTVFKMVHDEPVQLILAEVEIPVAKKDISAVPGQKKQEKKAQIFLEFSTKIFNLAEPPLLSILLVKLAAERYELMYNMHHIISDGWSLELFKKEILDCYQQYRNGKSAALSPLKLQYKDFTLWNHWQVLTGKESHHSHRYWKRRLEPGVSLLQLPRSINSHKQDLSGAAYRFFIEGELKERLNTLAKTNKTSLFVVMFSFYILALHRYSHQKEILCSIISAGRNHETLRSIVGFFVNSILFTTHVDPGEHYIDFLGRLHTDVLACFQHQDYPLEPLFHQLNMRYPQIAASFNMVNIQIPGPLENTTAGKVIKPFTPFHIARICDVRFELEPYVTEYQNGVDTWWVYKKSLFTPGFIEYFVKDYMKLMAFFPVNPHKSYYDFNVHGKKRKFFRKKGQSFNG